MRLFAGLSRPGRPGQALVEFALTFPLFFGLFFAIFDGARLMMLAAALENGVGGGARVGSICTPTCSGDTTADTRVRNAVVQNIVLVDPTPIRNSVTFSPTPLTTRVPLQPVTVSAQAVFDFNPVVGGLLGFAGLGTVTLSRTSTSTVEGTPPPPP